MVHNLAGGGIYADGYSAGYTRSLRFRTLSLQRQAVPEGSRHATLCLAYHRGGQRFFSSVGAWRSRE